MKGARRLSAALCVVFATSLAKAQEGITHPSEAELKSTSSTRGLCTSDNKETMFYKNYCASIKEQLQKPCAQDLIKKMRARLMGQQPQNDNRSFYFGGRFNCERADLAVKKSPQNFEMLIMEYMAAIAIAESGHREYQSLDNFAKADNAGKQGGLFNLKEEWIKDPKFECGCKNINSTGDGKDLTVNDAHLQATCATYVALYWAEKHGTFASGERKSTSKNCQHGTKPDDEDEGPKGAACIFKSLQETPRPPNAPPLPDNQRYNNPNLDFVAKKMKNYCEKNIGENGTPKVNEWNELDGSTLDPTTNR